MLTTHAQAWSWSTKEQRDRNKMAAFINNVYHHCFFFPTKKFTSRWENAHQLLSELDCNSIMSSSVGLVSVLSHSWRSPVVSAQKSRVPTTKIAKEIQNTSCQSLAHWKKWKEEQTFRDIGLEQSYQEHQGFCLRVVKRAKRTRAFVRACVFCPLFFSSTTDYPPIKISDVFWAGARVWFVDSSL